MPFYWLIWPENQALVAYQLDGEHDRVIATITELAPVRIPPFETIEMDLAYVLGN